VYSESQGGLDDRKTLGPIGTERAARRPTSMYPAEWNVLAAGGGSVPVHDSWNMYNDGTYTWTASYSTVYTVLTFNFLVCTNMYTSLNAVSNISAFIRVHGCTQFCS